MEMWLCGQREWAAKGVRDNLERPNGVSLRGR